MNVKEVIARIDDIDSIQLLFDGITAGHGIDENIEVSPYSLQRASKYLKEYKDILGQLNVTVLKTMESEKDG